MSRLPLLTHALCTGPSLALAYAHGTYLPGLLLWTTQPAKQEAGMTKRERADRRSPHLCVTFRKLPFTSTRVSRDLIKVKGLVAWKALPGPARSLPGPPHPGLLEEKSRDDNSTSVSERPAPTAMTANTAEVSHGSHCKDSEKQPDTGRDTADRVTGPGG